MQKLYEDADKIYRECIFWNEEVEINQVELKLLNALLVEQMVEKSKSKYVSYDGILDRIETLQTQNAHLKDIITNTDTKRAGLKECDDLQCEEHYIKEHLELKEKIEAYFADIRAIKKEVFKELSGNI